MSKPLSLSFVSDEHLSEYYLLILRIAIIQTNLSQKGAVSGPVVKN